MLKGTVCSRMTVTTRLIYPLSLSPVWTTVCCQVSLPLSCRTCYIMRRPRARGNFRAPYLKNIMNSKMTAAEHQNKCGGPSKCEALCDRRDCTSGKLALLQEGQLRHWLPKWQAVSSTPTIFLPPSDACHVCQEVTQITGEIFP